MKPPSEQPVLFKSLDDVPLDGTLVLPPAARGFALLLHGITVQRDEFAGFYRDLARHLGERGWGSLRFDFRGHGESGGTSRDVSVIGEVLDIKAALFEARRVFAGPIALVATSFSGGPSILAASSEPSLISRLAFIAPVLDYRRTFLEPTTEWARTWFTPEALAAVTSRRVLMLGDFALGPRLIEEFRAIEPVRMLADLRQPLLLIHGQQDSMVPYEVSRDCAASSNGAIRFLSLPDVDHGFPVVGDDEGTSAESQRNKARMFDEIAWFLDQP